MTYSNKYNFGNDVLVLFSLIKLQHHPESLRRSASSTFKGGLARIPPFEGG